ncbi:MAG: putative addiction module antidote protein [Sphingomonadales bacterium]
MAKPKFRAFDASDYLEDDEMMADYLATAAADPNPDVFLLALADVAKARGMSEIARATGLGRESLYKALSPGAKPRYETIAKVVSALGGKITVEAR